MGCSEAPDDSSTAAAADDPGEMKEYRNRVRPALGDVWEPRPDKRAGASARPGKRTANGTVALRRSYNKLHVLVIF